MIAARLTGAVTAIVTVALLALLLRPAPDAPAAPAPVLAAATGQVEISNSKEGAAILQAPNWQPGQAAKGKVAISNSGDIHGVFRLSAKQLTELPGVGGGHLSKVTRVRVARKRSVLGRFEVVFKGKLAKLASVRVGDWPAGGSRYFRLRAQPRPRSGEVNALQGASMSLTFRWRAAAQ